MAVPTTPGLGVELDGEKLETLHRQYVECGLGSRDDTGYMAARAGLRVQSPRW